MRVADAVTTSCGAHCRDDEQLFPNRIKEGLTTNHSQCGGWSKSVDERIPYQLLVVVKFTTVFTSPRSRISWMLVRRGSAPGFRRQSGALHLPE